MYHHIMIATDGSELSHRALEHGLALAKAVGADVTALTVTEGWAVSDMASRAELGDKHPVDDYEAEAQRLAWRILDKAREKAEALGVACAVVHEPDSHPSEAILRVAQARGCDLIVVSTHAREGLARLVIGSQAAQVIAGAKVPVLVCR
jgi:nucleotide-binding universal stress UspA family protein